jgi:hypothetical protein
MSVKISSLNTASTISSGDDINIAGNNPLTFSDWGGGWFMQDSAWIRSYNSKSLWMNSGLIGADGGLTIGYGGGTPPSGGAIIAGNVGIGTTSPADTLSYGKALDIQSSTGAAIYLRDSDATSVYGLFAYDGGGINRTNIGGIGANNYVRIISAGNEAIRIDASGNVGIGTTNPLNLLHVSQPSANTIFRLGNNASYDQFIYFNGGNDWSLGMDYSNSNAFVLSNSSTIGTNDRVVVTTAGNVGIGSTVPNEKLTVNGKGYFISYTPAVISGGGNIK